MPNYDLKIEHVVKICNDYWENKIMEKIGKANYFLEAIARRIPTINELNFFVY